MRWKWILGILAAVVAVVLVVVYIIAASYDYNKLKPMITNTVKELTGRELTMGGNIHLKIGIQPTLEVNNVAFQNAPWGSQPQMAQIKQLQVQVSILPLIRGNVTVNRLILTEPQFMLEVNKSGKTNLDFDASQRAKSQQPEDKPKDEGQALFEFEEIEIKSGKIEYKDHQTGKTETVDIETLEIENPMFGAATDIDLKGSYNKTPFQVTGNLGHLSGILNPKESWPLKLEAKAVKTRVLIDGNIQDPLSGHGIDFKLNAEGEDLAYLESITGEPLPVKGPFRFSGHVVTPSDKEVQVSDLLVVLGESRIKGTVKFTRGAKRPRIDAKLMSQKLDLRPMLVDEKISTDAQQQPAGDGKKKGKVFTDTPLQLDAFYIADALVQFTAAQILLPQLAFEDLQVDMSLKDGLLKIEQLEAGDNQGGKLAGNIELASPKANATLKLNLEIDQLDLGHMAKNLGISDAVDGKLNVNLDLRGRGNSVAALMGGLNGDTKVVMSEGKINMRYINLIGGDLRASLTRLFNPLSEKEEFAAINCLVSHFRIKDGLAESQVLVIDTNRMTVVGEGNINLKTEELDLGVKPDPKEGLGAGKVATINVSLSEFAKPFRLKGTLANPSLGIDPTKTALTFGKTLGGIALFGPVGLATSLVSGKFGENHPCAQALTTLGKKEKAKSEKSKAGGIGSKIKNLFSNPK